MRRVGAIDLDLGLRRRAPLLQCRVIEEGQTDRAAYLDRLVAFQQHDGALRVDALRASREMRDDRRLLVLSIVVHGRLALYAELRHDANATTASRRTLWAAATFRLNFE